MTDEQAERIEQKLDRLLELESTIHALGAVVIRRQTVIDRTDINKNAFNKGRAFEEKGKVKTFIEIGEIKAVIRRKRNR